MYSTTEVLRGTMQGLSLVLLCASVVLYGWTNLFQNFTALQDWLKIIFLSMWVVLLLTGVHQWRRFGSPPISFALRAKLQGYPEWFAKAYPALIAIVFLHFALFIFGGNGKPAIVDDQYVMQRNNGYTTPVSEQEYLKAQAPGLRLQSAFMCMFGSTTFVYWWMGAGGGRDDKSLIHFSGS